MSTDIVLTDPTQAPDLLSDPKLYMERTLGRAIMWLSEVEKVEDVVASKALASAYEVFIREKELGHDAQLAATEIIRRCERRIGQMVRDGQRRGEVMAKGQNRVHAGRDVVVNNIPSPVDAAGVKHRSEGRQHPDGPS